jgi:hypothetical protein
VVEIEFVNHASFLVRSGEVCLLSDPWFEGRIFNDGWSLLSPTRHRWDDLFDVTHLWLSHEHPDHFNTATLNAIPSELRARIEVLYQRTRDRKIVEWCGRRGFRGVRELTPHVPTSLAADFRVICGPMHPGDSWLAIRTPETSLLNLNDCEVNTPEQAQVIRGIIGATDVLFTQFSIAAWDGNADEPERLRARARFMLERMKMQSEAFEPRFIVPFASFVWFCHEENRFMNEGANHIGDASDSLRESVAADPVVLYPGDRWRVGEPVDSGAALERYARDYADCATRESASSASLSEGDLFESSQAYVETLRRDAGRLRMRLRLATKHFRHRLASLPRPTLRDRLALTGILLFQRIEPSSIHVVDLGRSYLFDLDRGLRPCALSKEACDVWLRSDSLHYCFKFLWGGDTLQINGRFQEIHPDSRINLFEDFWMAKGLNAGDPLTWRSFLQTAGRRLLGRGDVGLEI